jgi:hypothetical protein
MVSFADGDTISIVQPIPYAFVRYAREGGLCWESRNGHTEFIFQIADLPVTVTAYYELRDRISLSRKSYPEGSTTRPELLMQLDEQGLVFKANIRTNGYSVVS